MSKRYNLFKDFKTRYKWRKNVVPENRNIKVFIEFYLISIATIDLFIYIKSGNIIGLGIVTSGHERVSN